jgi:PKD repeat protein
MNQKVYVHPMPQADFAVSDSIQCLRYNQFSFYDSSSIDYGSINYLWDFDDLTTSNSQNPVHQFSFFDSFDVKLKVTSLNGCSDSVTRQMVVHPMPVASFNINDSQQCYNQNNFSFANTSSVFYGFNTYQWNFGDLQTSLNNNPDTFIFMMTLLMCF